MTKTAVVTGGGSHIGAAITQALARDGFDVFVTYIAEMAECAGVVAAVEAMGRKITAVQCDAGYKAQVDALYRQVSEVAGAPDVLVNNAGVQTWSSLLDLEEADWDRVIRTNLKGCFLNTQAAARLMVATGRGGRIVNIGSGCNRIAFPNLVDYTASKGGIEMFTKVSAVELGQYNITVNCIAPGAIETVRTQQEAPDYAGGWAKITPLGRVGYPSDVADAVMLLVDARAGFITGQTINSDGGVFNKPNWPPYPE